MSQHGGHRRRSRTPGPPRCSIQSFKSSEQYLEAMKEDLAEWLRDLYGLDIDADNFLQVLETGLVLCRHANTVTEAALAFLAEAPARAQRISLPQAGVFCNEAAQPGTFQARDNVSNFIHWCRKEMGIQEVLMFETEDLVLRKNVKNVVLCLLELGRRAWRFGVAAPTLVQLEEEIDAELRRELALPPPDPPRPAPPARRPCHFRNLDQMVQSLVSHCTCPVQFSMVKISEGKYQVGDSNTLIFIRILRSHVMVRVGGGWDTLGHYLDKHDPCRCTSLSHKPGSFLKAPVPPVQHEVRVQDGPSQAQPTMTISRSQSPLPPVDWRTYTSSSRKLRPFTLSSPRSREAPGAGAGPLRETAPFLRSHERSLTPSQKLLSAGDSLPSPQFSSIHGARDPWDSQSETRHPGELPGRRTPTSWVHKERDSWGAHARVPTSQRLQALEAANKATSASGPSPPPRSSSLIKPPGTWLPQRGASPQLKEPVMSRSSSPSKGLTKIPIRMSSARPPTPARSFLGTENGGPMAELRGDPVPLRTVIGNLAGSKHGRARLEFHKADIQVTADGGASQDLGTQEQEGRHASLPLGRTKEQALCHSLEEDIVANMTLLEIGAPCPQGTESRVIPRSGVYVPSLGGRWPQPGGPYDKVIQELAQGPPPLLKVDPGAWKKVPAGFPKPAVTTSPGIPEGTLGVRKCGPRTKESRDTKGSRVSATSLPGEQDCSAPTVSVISEGPPPSSPDPSSDKAKACLGKGKRTLRTPRKVPSIYKLRLRPRIRPRRDHRPEKRPSRIPKPLAYLCLGPARAPPRDRLLRAALGTKGGDACQVGGASAGEREEEERRREPAARLHSGPQPLEDQGPQQVSRAPLPPEKESWV
uniref:GAS2-like protein 2 n=1 Tax=Jaculus jaculus TaxID=51337 RepID=UPI001E1AF50C|nr:GAS2-like protein 2 [Jaculus jaculus]